MDGPLFGPPRQLARALSPRDVFSDPELRLLLIQGWYRNRRSWKVRRWPRAHRLLPMRDFVPLGR